MKQNREDDYKVKASLVAQFADKILSFTFYALFFFTPIVITQATLEVFEFNKMMLTYALAVIIISAWIFKMTIAQKLIFRRTFLDIPLLVFLASQILATIFSIDKHTSFWGYYSRFNGGLLSSITYSLLYWSFVSNFDLRLTVYALRFLLASAIFVSLWGIPAHFGFDPTCAIFGYGLNADCWTPEFVPTLRIFSTLGQPNWLAAWLVAVSPIAWLGLVQSIELRRKLLFAAGYLLIAILFFLAFLYTGSRSGLLGFATASAIFWTGVFWVNRTKWKKFLPSFLILNSLFLLLIIIVGTPVTPKFGEILKPGPTPTPTGAGGTESGTIRQIVWKGATSIWRHYPIFGTGPETFAYSYYNFRPKEHNLVSEWDFLYNKAHNEYLNFAANTGTAGLVAYLVLIGAFLVWAGAKILRYKDTKSNSQYLSILISLLAGYASILVTNFFGFSVVPVSLLFFLYPAMAITLESGIKNKELGGNRELYLQQKLLSLFTLILASFFLIQIARLWVADTKYAEAERLADQGQETFAFPLIIDAIKFNPAEPVYQDELANIASSLAQRASEEKQATLSANLAKIAIDASEKSISVSPRHLNFLKLQATMFIRLSALDQNYLFRARDTLLRASQLAPTDPKVAYNLGLLYSRIGEQEKAKEWIEKTIELKPDYEDALKAFEELGR